MTFTKILTIVSFASLSLSGFAIEPAELYGTWQLVSVSKTSVATGKISDVLGPHPAGYLTYTIHLSGLSISGGFFAAQ